MTTTTNYALNIVEGTDIVNPLTQFNPNFNTIDGVMKDNADAAVSPATCIKTGTVHTITRTNTGSEMFVFTATGDWNTGDTMTVDGTPVTPALPDGSALITGSYLINAEVLASIKGTKVTIYSNKTDLTALSNSIAAITTDSAIAITSGNVVDLSITGQHFVRNDIAYIFGAMRADSNISNYICDLNVTCSGDANWVGVNRTTHQMIAGYISQNKIYCNEGVINANDLFLINVSFKITI